MNKSLYDVSKFRHTKLKNTGYNYENKIFQKTMSPHLFNEEKRRDILLKMEQLVFFLIEKSKYIKNYFNYTVPSDYKHLN